MQAVMGRGRFAYLTARARAPQPFRGRRSGELPSTEEGTAYTAPE